MKNKSHVRLGLLILRPHPLPKKKHENKLHIQTSYMATIALGLH